MTYYLNDFDYYNCDNPLLLNNDCNKEKKLKKKKILKEYKVEEMASEEFDYYDLDSSDGFDKVFADGFKLGFLAGFKVDK